MHEVRGWFGLAFEDGMLDADGGGCLCRSVGFVILGVRHANGERADVGTSLVCDGRDEGGVEPAG